MGENKKYAVVKFFSDNTYSEVPITWLVTGENNIQQCWWPPRTANSKPMIANCTNPNCNTWTKYDVEIIRYCSSFESARKSAADDTYCTTDEERLGRGYREKRFHPYNYTSTEEEENNCFQSRKQNFTKKYPNASATVSTLPSVPDNFGSNTKGVLQLNDTTECNYIAIHDEDAGNNATLQRSDDESQLRLDKIPIIIEGSTPLVQNVKEDSNIKKNIENMLRMQAAGNIILRDIQQRITKFEDVIKNRGLNLPESNSLIAHLLPLNTKQDIKKFESILKTTNDEAVIQFREFVSKIGGNNPKHAIQQTMKKIFTNECAMMCSWKGYKKNFRVDDLYLIKIMKRDLTLKHVSLTESEFDNIVAEWLRFARQRKQREDKEQQHEQNNQDENVEEDE